MLGWMIKRVLRRCGINTETGKITVRLGKALDKRTVHITLRDVTIISRHVSLAPLMLEKIEADVYFSLTKRYLQITGLLPMQQTFAVYGQKTKSGFDVLLELQDFSIDKFKAVFHNHLISTFIKCISSDTLLDIKASYQHDNSVRFPKFYTHLQSTGPFSLCSSHLIIDKKYIINELVSRNHISSHYISFDRITELIKVAVVSTEDPTFWLHKGFSEITVGMAMRDDINRGRLSMGGSSISQQLIKNAMLTSDRTLYRKAEEMVLTLLMENSFHTPKTDILEVYLNMIELAPSVYGIHDGARYYFNKPYDKLDIEEVLMLTYIIPRPITFDREWKENNAEQKRKLRDHIDRYSPTVMRKLGKTEK